MSFGVRRRARKADQFVQIDNTFLRDETLSIEARGLGAYLLTHAEDFRLSSTFLGKATGLGRDKLRRVLGELEREGYLVREQARDGGRFAEDEFSMSDEKPQVAPVTENPSPVNQSPETRVHKKTNSEKTKIEEDHEGSSSSEDDGQSDAPPPADKREKARNAEYDSEFEDWWRAYPRKVGKDAARIKYRAVRKGGTSEQALLDALAAHAAGWHRERRAKAYIPHAATWLNQGRYADEDLPGSDADGRATNTRYDGAYWAGQQTEERDENGYTAEDRLMMERHGVTISYGHGK